MPENPSESPLRRTKAQDSPLADALDWQLIEAAGQALESGLPVTGEFAIRNVNRTVGGLLSHELTKRHGAKGLPPRTIRYALHGSAGQSFGAWLAPGVELTLFGDANDYAGKGLSGGVITVRPPLRAGFVAEENVIVGNTVLYGATAGRAFFAGRAGERFAVRNSGASAVVEGVGDHGCEYMTGGRVVVLGPTGRNFAAGMSGGIAYVLDPDATFASRCNLELVELEPLEAEDVETVRALVEEHLELSGSVLAGRVLDDWELMLPLFVKVMPRDYKAALADIDELTVSSGGDGFLTTESEGAGLMGKLRGFLEFDRVTSPERDPAERVDDYKEFVGSLPLVELRAQGARCMECGVPFCNAGCPLGNLIPDWNDLVYRDNFAEAIEQLHRTNNFPEFTGRLCPAPCEAACVLEIDEGNAVTIKQIEVSIVNRAWEEGWIVPQPPATRTGRTVAVIGSGPAGLACAQQLNRRGHTVTVFERDEAAGGLVRFGVPDFKIEKWLVERRVQQLVDEGVEFRYGVDVGVDVEAAELRDGHDAVVVATGSRVPRDLPVPGRELDGVHFAMEYLYQRNRFVAGAPRARARDLRGRQARDRDRRRRHGRRLRRQRAPRGRRVGDADRARRRAAALAARRRDAVAALADEAAHVLRAERGRRARLRDLDHALLRQRRPGRADPLDAEHRRAAVRRRAGDRGDASRRARAARDGLPRAGDGAPRAARRRARRARQRRRGGVRDLRRRRLRRRRRAPRPVADRVGDRRGRRCAAAVDRRLAAR